jgi:hypothetical protein
MQAPSFFGSPELVRAQIAHEDMAFAALKSLESAKQHNGDGREVVTAADLEEHVLPGGVGTFSIRQVTDSQLREASVAASMVEMADAAGSGATVRGAPSTMWQDSGIDKRSRGKTVDTPRTVLFYGFRR